MQLAAHYLHVHKERREMKIAFGFSDDEEENGNQEEEKKQLNTEITKENYRELFPTLGQANRLTKQEEDKI